ncbi:hypothetical protein BCR39DRAFT_32218 [Naematelia encephala]|uniref:Uncharacterized protein n=1 Tax=Naematelia encephala TaxID=71784 RepID=A0A1Y2BLX2_9TREE|nr:hypothetical protein BCR39DRAFT_32218 [Naematelia encephala]
MTPLKNVEEEHEDLGNMKTQFHWSTDSTKSDNVRWLDVYEGHVDIACDGFELNGDEKQEVCQCAGELNTSDAQIAASLLALATGMSALTVSQITDVVGRFTKDVKRSAPYSESPVVSRRKSTLKTLLGESSSRFESVFAVATEEPKPEKYSSMSSREAFIHLSICKDALSRMSLALISHLLGSDGAKIKRTIEKNCELWRMAIPEQLDMRINRLLKNVSDITHGLLSSGLQDANGESQIGSIDDLRSIRSKIRKNLEKMEEWMQSRMGEGNLSAAFRELYEARHPAAELGLYIRDIRRLDGQEQTSNAEATLQEITRWPLSFERKEEPFYSQELITLEMSIPDTVRGVMSSTIGDVESTPLPGLLTVSPDFLSGLKERREEGNTKLIVELYMRGKWSGTLPTTVQQEVERRTSARRRAKKARQRSSRNPGSSSATSTFPTDDPKVKDISQVPSDLASTSTNPGPKKGRGRRKGAQKRDQDTRPNPPTDTRLNFLKEVSSGHQTPSVANEQRDQTAGPSTDSGIIQSSSSQGPMATRDISTGPSQATVQSGSTMAKSKTTFSTDDGRDIQSSRLSDGMTNQGVGVNTGSLGNREPPLPTSKPMSKWTAKIIGPWTENPDFAEFADLTLPPLDEGWLTHHFANHALEGTEEEWWRTYNAATGLS